MLKSAAFAAALAFFATGQASPAQSSASIDVPSGAQLLLSAKGEGAQVYTCTAGHWTLKAPDAKLFDSDGKQIGTHFAGPTWKLNDGSEVKGKAVANRPSPDSGSVAWLLLQALPASGSGQFAHVTYIQRTETHGGVAPKDACASGDFSVPYTAQYSFYGDK